MDTKERVYYTADNGDHVSIPKKPFENKLIALEFLLDQSEEESIVRIRNNEYIDFITKWSQEQNIYAFLKSPLHEFESIEDYINYVEDIYNDMIEQDVIRVMEDFEDIEWLYIYQRIDDIMEEELTLIEFEGDERVFKKEKIKPFIIKLTTRKDFNNTYHYFFNMFTGTGLSITLMIDRDKCYKLLDLIDRRYIVPPKEVQEILQEKRNGDLNVLIGKLDDSEYD